MILNLLFLLLINFGLSSSDSIKTKTIYSTKTLIINQLSAHSFQHISFLETESFGKVECNGLIVIDANEAFIFDTPTTDSVSAELINWMQNSLNCEIKGVIPTHFHDDCLGGLESFHQVKIPSFAFFKTIEKAKLEHLPIPKHSFDDSKEFELGQTKLLVSFLGEAHAMDNIVGYFQKDQILFGGCMIKSVGASKGFLGDANVGEWSKTVSKVKAKFNKAKIIVPGHGTVGGQELLDYTISLFKE
ncbi:MAG: subclass B1 metallo-beta-lactamase [Bacteroidetes bacterium]|nr:subclass B1 metallo-beta-lactamase [Bacteroidota bacterium]